MVSGTISLPCSGFFSPFLHSTRSLSVSQEYLALPDGPGGFAQDSSCPALLRILLCCISLHILDYHRLWSHFPKCSVHNLHTMSQSYNPHNALRRHRFGLFPGRSPLLGESFIYFLFLQVLRCFSSLRSPRSRAARTSCVRVPPFGHLRITSRLRIPGAFRSLPRPSSLPEA